MFIIAAVALLESLPWIGAGNPPGVGADWYNEKSAGLFKCEFTMSKGRDSAKATIACLGCYELMCNGYLNDGPMPLWSPFAHTVYADTYELTKLRPGKNFLFVHLGNGFYNLPPLRFWGALEFRSFLTSGEPCFKLAIEGATDVKWSVADSFVLKNSVYLGTEVSTESTLTDKMFRPVTEVVPPRVGKIVERRAPAVVKIGEVCGVAKWLDEKNGVQLVDLGANLTGRLWAWIGETPSKDRRVDLDGRKIEFVYGERLNADGRVNFLTQTAGQIKRPGMGGQGAPAIAMQRDVVHVGKDGFWYAEFPFSWHVCRYIEIRGCPKLLNFRFGVISSDLKESDLGKNHNSKDDRLNQLHEVCRRTFRDNLIGVQSDCPGRERLGYGGDIVATCEAMCLNYDMKEFYLKTLQDFADEASVDGWITETAPFVGIADADGIESHGKQRKGPISWALVVPVLMDTVIRHYPDAKDRALAFYPTCTRYIALVDAANPSGIVPKCIGDHEALERAPDTVTATAHWYEFVRLTAKFAVMLGKDEDAKKYTALAEKVRGAFAAAFVKDGKVANGTQSAQAIALYLGLVPADQISAAGKLLVEAIHAKGDALSTGLFSTRYMLMYLSEHGELDLARRIVLHKGFPGWMHMLERGATTLWETWAESADTYSNCHPMFGSVDEWILKYGK